MGIVTPDAEPKPRSTSTSGIASTSRPGRQLLLEDLRRTYARPRFTLRHHDSGRATIDCTPEKGGQYQVTATGQGHAATSSAAPHFVYAASASITSWPRENNDRIEPVADKSSYAQVDGGENPGPKPFTGRSRRW